MKELAVLKYGSDSVTNADGIDHERIEAYAENDIAPLHERYSVIVVSSGAVAVGRQRWEQAGRDPEQADRRILAPLGSAGASAAWERALDKVGLLAGQGLVTHREIDDPGEGSALIKALRDMVEDAIVPVINENDLLSDEELKKLIYGGDNDGLASHIAIRMRASRLFLLTNVEGLLSTNGIILEVKPDFRDWRYATQQVGLSSGAGTGGMQSKVDACIEASKAGVDSYIARAGTSIDDIIAGQSGTHFVAMPARTR